MLKKVLKKVGILFLLHCPKNGPHITLYRADAKDAILYGP